MSQTLLGKVALITGGGGGIGRATALLLAKSGASIVVADQSAKAGAETLSLIDEPTGGIFVHVDVTDPESVQHLVDQCVDAFGRLDIAFNNAGVQFAETQLAETPVHEWNRLVTVNLSGVFFCLQAEIRTMLKTGGGSIINAGSILSVGAMDLHGAYSATKHGVIGLTRSAALEYSSRGIRVNALLPGVIDTPMVAHLAATIPGYSDEMRKLHPIGRIGQPEEVAQAVLWLASDASSFVTGSSLTVDGGYTIT